MKIAKTPVIFLAAFTVLTAGCTTSKPALEGQLDPNLGHAVNSNVQAQFVTPTDKQKADTFIPFDPARAALARKNYKENTVPTPRP